MQTPVRIKKFRTCETYAVEIPESRHEFVKPERRDLGVIVKDGHELAARQFSAGIAGAHESLIPLLSQDADAAGEILDAARLIRRAVVDDNDFE